MDKAEKLARLRLIRTPNVGPMTFRLLIQRYGTAVAALSAIPELSKRGGRTLQPASLETARREWEANEAAGARLLFRDGEEYPRSLDRFDDAPAVISVKGNAHLLTRPIVAMVGARNASINALRHAEKLATELSDEGYVVASGLARGIDTAAHNGALTGGTIAVIAGGIDDYYPPENIELQEAIEQTGLVIAEMPPGTKPTPRHFPIRNRVIASLALGVVVVEAAARSGSLITAREAAERGGEVMAVPGSPLDPRAEGCNALIREGATLVQNTGEIVECLSRPVAAGLPEHDDLPQPIQQPGPESAIAECRMVILQGLGTEPTEIDDLVRWCKADTATVLAALLELELAGSVYRHHGNRVSKRADL